MRKYTIEISERQARLLSMAAEFTSRFICGQTNTSSWPHAALHGKAQDKLTHEEWCEMRDWIDGAMDAVKMKGWGMSAGAHYGVGYNKDSDVLWDFYQVVRHQLWKDYEGEKSSITVDAYPAMKFGDESLPKIEKL